MKNGVATGDVKIWKTVKSFAKIQAFFYNKLHLFPFHGNDFRVSFCKDVAVLAPLVAVISNMKLKCEILLSHNFTSMRKAQGIGAPAKQPTATK